MSIILTAYEILSLIVVTNDNLQFKVEWLIFVNSQFRLISAAKLKQRLKAIVDPLH